MCIQGLKHNYQLPPEVVMLKIVKILIYFFESRWILLHDFFILLIKSINKNLEK